MVRYTADRWEGYSNSGKRGYMRAYTAHHRNNKPTNTNKGGMCMKKMQAGRIAALFLCLVLLLNLFPMTAFAADESSSNGVQSEQ